MRVVTVMPRTGCWTPQGGRARALGTGFEGVGEVRVGASAQLREDPWAGPEHADHLLVNALIEDYRVELAG